MEKTKICFFRGFVSSTAIGPFCGISRRKREHDWSAIKGLRYTGKVSLGDTEGGRGQVGGAGGDAVCLQKILQYEIIIKPTAIAGMPSLFFRFGVLIR